MPSWLSVSLYSRKCIFHRHSFVRTAMLPAGERSPRCCCPLLMTLVLTADWCGMESLINARLLSKVVEHLVLSTRPACQRFRQPRSYRLSCMDNGATIYISVLVITLLLRLYRVRAALTPAMAPARASRAYISSSPTPMLSLEGIVALLYYSALSIGHLHAESQYHYQAEAISVSLSQHSALTWKPSSNADKIFDACRTGNVSRIDKL